MRLTKNPELITHNEKTGHIVPFRTLLLDENEIALVDSFAGPEPTPESEDALRGILAKRGMEHLLYSDKKIEQWSGFVMLKNNELWLL